MEEKCDFPRCKGWDTFVYINKDICQEHWNQLCEADSKTEKRMLKKIGLKRDKNGMVVAITGEETK